MTFTPGKFYVDPVSEITYLCVDDYTDLAEFVFWNDEENEFILVGLKDVEHFKLKDVQEWE